MKTKRIHNRAGIALGALAAIISIAPTAKAIVLAYESDPDGAGPLTIGSPYLGQVQIKFNAFNEGSDYALVAPTNLPPGPQGFNPGAGYSTASVATGITSLNGLAQTAVTNGFPGTVQPGSIEDQWGVGTITSILTPGGAVVWSELGKGTQLTAVFHGEQDFHIAPNPLNPGAFGDSIVSGVGLQLDIYEDGTPGGSVDPTTPFNPALGPGGRTGAATYLTASDGTLQLSLRSTAGFISTDLGLGGPNAGFGGKATEYRANFNFGSLTGDGVTFFNVVGGAQQGVFDTNGITSPAGNFNFGVGTAASFADFRATFTSNPGQFGFDVTANDPLTGNAVPEPTTVLAGLGCMLPIFGSVFGRNRRRKSA